MDSDLLLVVGIIVGALSVPAMISAFSESRPPRAAAILVLIAAGLIVTAVTQKPSGYRIDDIPNVFIRVIGDIVHGRV